MNNVTLTADVNSKVNLVKSIANKTRGPYTPEKYGNVIIPMAIIRRFDCILADKNAAIEKILMAASKLKGMTPEKLEEMVKRQCNVPFYNAKCVSLEQLVGDSDNLNSNFLEFIKAYSPSVQKILQDLKFKEEVEFMIKKGILFEVVKAFSEVDFHPATTSPMAMGYIFEEIIRTYKSNAEAGDHYTPREVIELCVELMMSENVEELKKDGKIIRVYDSCCGTGGMLTTIKRKLTDPEGGLGMHIPFPSVEVQRHIVNGLKVKLESIDALLTAKEKTNALLKERRQSIIYEAVTKGLNPDAPMKGSGIEWIGEIPEHWDMLRLRFLGTFQNGISKAGEFFGSGYPFVSYGDVYRVHSVTKKALKSLHFPTKYAIITARESCKKPGKGVQFWRMRVCIV